MRAGEEFMANHKVNESILKLRKSHGETQEQLANFLGTTRGNICQIEKGRHDVSIDDLKRLSAHYFTPLAKLIEGSTTEEFDWKSHRFIMPSIEEEALNMFPIVAPDSDDLPKCFQEATDLHIQYIHDSCSESSDNGQETENEFAECREKYLLSMQNEEIRLFAKANWISLYLFLARVLNATIHSKDSPYPLKEKLYNEPQKVGKTYNENAELFDRAFSALRTEFISGFTRKYLEDLSNDEEFKTLSDYFEVLIYAENLVANNDGIIENCHKAEILRKKLINEGNIFMIDFECYWNKIIKS